MFEPPWHLATLVPFLALALVHLTGIIVAIILLVQRRSTPAILALVGFGLLFIVGLASLARGPLLNFLVRQVRVNQFWAVSIGTSCCCSGLDMVAFVCLIVAIWQAVSARSSPDAVEVEEMVGEFVEISEPVVREGE